MALFTEREAETLPPEQAAALVRILNLQARWDGLLAVKAKEVTALHAKQKANDAFRAALRDYTEKYSTARVPEPSHVMPDRMAMWCRTLRALFLKAEGVDPTEVMDRAYRLADRIAARAGKDPVDRQSGLDGVIAWCDAMATPAPLVKPKKSA